MKLREIKNFLYFFQLLLFIYYYSIVQYYLIVIFIDYLRIQWLFLLTNGNIVI